MVARDASDRFQDLLEGELRALRAGCAAFVEDFSRAEYEEVRGPRRLRRGGLGFWGSRLPRTEPVGTRVQKGCEEMRLV